MKAGATLAFESPSGQASLEQLEFHKVLDAFGRHAVTSFARAALAARIPRTNVADIREELETVGVTVAGFHR